MSLAEAGSWKLVAGSKRLWLATSYPLPATSFFTLLLVSCTSFGGERPRYEPLPQSVRLTVDQVARALIVSLDSSLRAAGLGVAHSAPREGYLESEWFDAVTRVRSPQPFNDGNVIKLRFFADPEQGRTRLLAESVVRIAWDPSVPQRELERMAPEGHVGRMLLDSLLMALAPPVRPPPLRP